MSMDVLKRCKGTCGLEYPLVFFRYRAGPKLAAASFHPYCLACEQECKDTTKRQNRWPQKARNTIRTHAEKYGLTAREFTAKYGWDIIRVTHILKHASENTCCYCREPYEGMGHGLADITMDIVDPRKEPFLETNTQPCCNTCNQRKGNRTPEEWAVILRCWRQHDRQKELVDVDPLMRFPLWQFAATQSSLLKGN